jgi:spermidine synthase
MTNTGPSRRELLAIALVSGTLLMTELALTRIFSVVMYYHFAFLAISIALFGLSASGVFAYVCHARLARHSTSHLLSRQSVLYAVATLVALFLLVRLRVGLNYSPRNLWLMLAIYTLAALPFFAGGLILTIAISRYSAKIGAVYGVDLCGAAAGCLVLIPLLNAFGAPGVVLTAAALALLAAVLFAPAERRLRVSGIGAAILAISLAGQFSGLAGFDVLDTKGHEGDRILFSKWNSFSRVGVYERAHGDWSLSDAYDGPLPETRFMDIDSAASTPIVHVSPNLTDAGYLRYELTALAYQLKEDRKGHGFTALVIGPGGGRDLLSALVFGARRVDGVEINPIIADDVMRGQFREFSGGIYVNPRVQISVDDGRSFVRRTPNRYDVIQASLVDTWAATAAGAYTLTENTLYTVEAFSDYVDHLSDEGVLSITRWVFDGLRLVSLAQAACEMHGWDAGPRLAILQQGQVATFLLKRSPFTADELSRLHATAERLGFRVLYTPADRGADNDYARLIEAPDRQQFFREFRQEVTPTTDDRPFFFHTTKLRDQFQVAFGRAMLFGNGLSALLTLMGISTALVAVFVLAPLVLLDRRSGARSNGWLAWLVYFGALGAGFMLIEVSVLQHFVLLLGHPVYSLTVTLFSLLLGTGIGAAWSRRVDISRVRASGVVAVGAIVLVALVLSSGLTPLVTWAIPFSRLGRIVFAATVLVPFGMLLGLPMPTGIRMLSTREPRLIPWAWGMNGALSVVGSTMAIFVAMNWGFAVTLRTAGVDYLIALSAFLVVSRAGSSLTSSARV